MDIRVTVVGCGAVVYNLYKRSLIKLERQGVLTVVGLVDSQLHRAEKLKLFFPKASVYENIFDALSASDSNLTIVASPPASHAEHSILSFQHESHVLCEKPMATTTTACEQMIEAARSSGLQLAIGMTRRFYPSLAHLINLLINGELGEICSFSYREGGVYDWPVTTSASFRREKGGGVFADKGPHILDSIIWLFGAVQIISYYDDAMIGGVESNCVMHIGLPNGSGLIHLSWDQSLANEFRIVGTKAEAIVGMDEIDKLVIKKSGQYQKFRPKVAFPMTTSSEKLKMGIPKSYPECIYFQLIKIIRAIIFGEHIPVTGEEGREVVSHIQKCYKIAKPIDMTWLPSTQNEAYEKLHWRNT